MGFIFRRSPAVYGERRRGGFRILPILLFLVVGAFYYFSNQEVVPVTGRSQFVDMDRKSEVALGLQSYNQVLAQSQVVTDGPEVALVRSIGARLAAISDIPEFEWEFNLINSDQVNAFCLPGGKVAVYRGLLPVAQNEDGLAVVMAHEIGHAVARHGAERMAQQNLAQLGQIAVGMSVSDMDPGARQTILGAFGLGTQFGVLLPFSRKHESEADYIGLIYMARACFNPSEAPRLWERMAQVKSSVSTPPEFLSTHPTSTTRIQQFREWMPKALEEYAKNCKSS